MLGQIASDPIERIEIDYVGRVAEMDTGPVRVATLAGVMAPFLDGPVNAVNAELIAQERGLKVLESREPGGDSEYASLLKLRAWTTSGAEHMAAGSVFRGQPRLLLFEDFGVDFVPQGELLTTRHKDTPGVLGQLAGWLGERGVNIGGMHMAPSPEGKTDEPALALFQIDRALTAEEERQLTDIPAIVSARSITF
jgi:D-3-phosphoglycerate dehydrogenase